MDSHDVALAVVTMGLVRTLTECEPVFDAAGGGRECIYCYLEPDNQHELACPWRAAKDFVGAHRGWKPRERSGFTLIELIVVITIILLVSLLTLPMVVGGIQHRQMSESARILQAALAGARDAAIRDNVPSGIRLLPDTAWQLVRLSDGSIDPTAPLASSTILPLSTLPAYTTGLVNAFPSQAYPPSVIRGTTAVVLEEATVDSAGLPPEPTSWFWNVRIGDRVQINGTGNRYTVIGPIVTANPDGFVNCGQPGAVSPLGHDWLLLVNGRDDNKDGVPDIGWNGVDDNANGVIDDLSEWSFSYTVSDPTLTYADPVNPGRIIAVGGAEYEPAPEVEVWEGKVVNPSHYVITRRPSPAANARATHLSTNVVVDLTTWGTTQERSRLQVDRLTGFVDIVVNPDGSVAQSTVYSTPASAGLEKAFAHFWLAERSDIMAPAGATAPTLPTPAGNSWLVTLFTRTGNLSSLENPGAQVNPFGQAQQGQ